MSKENFNYLFKTLAFAVAAIVGAGLGVMTLSGKVAPWTGRFYSLLDPSYAKNNIPIIASVSEHQPTSWSSFYFDLQVCLIFVLLNTE
jgi:dolichyl-diphosphooligosaccharide--protein glycosyltransferase